MCNLQSLTELPPIAILAVPATICPVVIGKVRPRKPLLGPLGLSEQYPEVEQSALRCDR